MVMLERQEYCGDVINFKTEGRTFRNKARRKLPKEKHTVFPDVHEPIISREDFHLAQEKRSAKTKRQQSKTKRNIFSGLLRCADCGALLGFHTNSVNKDIHYYNCQNNNSAKRRCKSTHYVRADFLEQVIKKEINCLVRFAKRDEETFAKMVMESVGDNTARDKQALEAQISRLEARDKELDKLFKRTYEDAALGQFSEERLIKLATGYEKEQASLTGQIEAAKARLTELEESRLNLSTFMELVRKHSNIRRLTSEILHSFIDHIKVYQAEKVDGQYLQRIDVFYNCIGEFKLPDIETVKKPSETTLQTRKGAVSKASE